VVAFPSMDQTRGNTLILLLISDPDMRTVIENILTVAGYLVLTASEIGAAVDRLKEGAPDLLIIRPYINSMPGHEAVKFLRTKTPGLRVLMVGGLIDDARLSYRDLIQNIHVFPKPFSAEQLLQAVQEALTRDVEWAS
jgi:DNA-binding NtrC family response regulator